MPTPAVQEAHEVEPRLWRRRAVERVTGLSTTSLYGLMGQGLFPQSRRVPGAPGVVVWVAEEVLAWCRELPVADPTQRPAKGRPAASEKGGT